MKIESQNIKSQQTISEEHIFNGFGCNGKNLSPQISWSDAPQEAESFAITIFDPDAPTSSGWWHWVVLNIPKNYQELPLNFGGDDKAVLKDEVRQVKNDFGTFKFGGPCPPEGDKPHRYIITVHALGTDELDIPDDASAALASLMINQNTIAKAELIGFYGR